MRHFDFKKVEYVRSITCDKCKDTYELNDAGFEFQEMVSIHETGGYASVFGDMNRIDLDLCQHCFKEIYDSIKAP